MCIKSKLEELLVTTSYPVFCINLTFCFCLVSRRFSYAANRAHYHAKLKQISCKIEFVYVFNPNSFYFRTIEKNNYVLNSSLQSTVFNQLLTTLVLSSYQLKYKQVGVLSINFLFFGLFFQILTSSGPELRWGGGNRAHAHFFYSTHRSHLEFQINIYLFFEDVQIFFEDYYQASGRI